MKFLPPTNCGPEESGLPIQSFCWPLEKMALCCARKFLFKLINFINQFSLFIVRNKNREILLYKINQTATVKHTYFCRCTLLTSIQTKTNVLFVVSVSNEVPEHPVVSPSSGAIFERRIIEKYIQENGVDPISGKELSADELIEIKSKLLRLKPEKN